MSNYNFPMTAFGLTFGYTNKSLGKGDKRPSKGSIDIWTHYTGNEPVDTVAEEDLEDIEVGDLYPVYEDPTLDPDDLVNKTLDFYNYDKSLTAVTDSFIILANHKGIYFPLWIECNLNSKNEKQTLVWLNDTGTFTLSYDDEVTPVTFTEFATKEEVQAGLELLPSIGAGNVAVSGLITTSGLKIEFIADLKEIDHPDLTYTIESGDLSLNIVTTQHGCCD